MAAFVNIVGWPSGAKIFKDDIEIGILPLYNIMFKWGKYKVEAKKEGYEPEVREEFVVFKEDRKKTIVFTLKKITEGL